MPLFQTHTEISPASYRFIAGKVYAHSRIQLGEGKQALVAGRLGKRLRQLKLPSFEAYCELLNSVPGGEELGQMVDLISTNHTNFFREAQHLDFLRDHILPELMPRRAGSSVPFRIWSAACSSGEEPYTLAIVLAEFARQHADCRWVIEASDISTRVLARAQAAIYPLNHVKLPEAEWLARYFQKGGGEHEGSCRVKDSLRQAVKFHHLNLLQELRLVRKQD